MFYLVKDVIRANILAMCDVKANRVFNICSEREIRILELAKLLSNNIEFGERRLHDVKNWEVLSQATGYLGWTPFKNGLAETLAWYKEQYSDTRNG